MAGFTEAIKHGLSKDYAGLPGWVWLLVVAGGGVAAYFIPKLLGGSSSSDASQTSSADTGTNANGIDPTTGLPYASESPLSGVGGAAQSVDLSQTNSLLQQLLALQQQEAHQVDPQNVTPPAPTPPATPSASGPGNGIAGNGGIALPSPLPIAPKPVPAPTTKPAQKAPPSVTPKPAQKIYTVKAGDTLQKIAQSQLGNSAAWSSIYAANRSVIGANPNLIKTDQKLVIP